jgi:hypothetical protein
MIFGLPRVGQSQDPGAPGLPARLPRATVPEPLHGRTTGVIGHAEVRPRKPCRVQPKGRFNRASSPIATGSARCIDHRTPHRPYALQPVHPNLTPALCAFATLRGHLIDVTFRGMTQQSSIDPRTQDSNAEPARKGAGAHKHQTPPDSLEGPL